MSDADGDDAEPPLPKKVVRSVSPFRGGRPDREMNVIGWGYFLGMLVLLVPMLPFLLVVWVLSKLFEALGSG